MERREHYDPEDIESLLQERSFDELLEEERAYVLRHLSGREEYEAMRALLGQVREDDRRREPVTADRGMRDAVMAAYRANQRPQWQVWLNSVGQLLWPKELSAMWRPALALGSLALLITAGVWVMRSAGDLQGTKEVAEVKNEIQKTEVPAPSSADPNSGSTAQPTTAARSEAAPLEEKKTRELAETYSTDEQMEVAADAGEDLSMPAPAEPPPTLETTKYLAVKDHMDSSVIAGNEGKLSTVTGTVADAPTFSATAPAHVVTEAELSQNLSLANVSGVTREVAKRKAEKNEVSASLGSNPELLALLSTGW